MNIADFVKHFQKTGDSCIRGTRLDEPPMMVYITTNVQCPKCSKLADLRGANEGESGYTVLCECGHRETHTSHTVSEVVNAALTKIVAERQ